MSIITFWSNGKEETAKTLSISAIATYMAVERNFRILELSTNFQDTTLENCYWEQQKEKKNVVGLGNGVEGLSQAIASNKVSPEIVTNYTKIVFKNRLDVLPGIQTDNYQEYEKTLGIYKEILKTANQFYDLIFIDLNKGLDKPVTREILAMSDIIVVNLTQRLKIINDYMALKEEEEIFNKKNIILLIGRYDRFSKYNSKNISRYMGEKEIYTVPYSTLFFEAANEGKVADFFLRYRNLDEGDRNALFISEVKRAADRIVYKIQELQMKM